MIRGIVIGMLCVMSEGPPVDVTRKSNKIHLGALDKAMRGEMEAVRKREQEELREEGRPNYTP